MSDDGIDADKAAALRLRARLAVVERAAWFGIVHAMRTRPAETEAYITSERARCTEGFGSGAWAKDLTDAERKMLADEVDSGLAQLLEDARGEV
ncbi:hypothetical protein GOFOIKOB_3824 [Methylobacterium tardum]|jgi:hypothetical protein|uniref:Uncharacterized protein n=1 Tax=Methylobacterium tardum TaxID=374432 RepID=A0AA37WRR5_9HYPH|nr:hypothetical protein [Methylobacterium tardum]URD39019.1 hypothetical protein M6G65_11755 [Methylobacterium tardum]GJE50771.1 hypothetical protein GOFOIKOB_3824 [Methylobacterium tardum]GLS68338.1 hypothetical protein GCM10007890_03500 [Methylobacterium tardum]